TRRSGNKWKRPAAKPARRFGSRLKRATIPPPIAGRRRRQNAKRRNDPQGYSPATHGGAATLSLGLTSQASSQLTTLSDLTNLPTPSTSAQNSPSSMISSSEKCLASSA